MKMKALWGPLKVWGALFPPTLSEPVGNSEMASGLQYHFSNILCVKQLAKFCGQEVSLC